MVLIKPGGVKTPLWASGMHATDEVLQGIPQEGMEKYWPLWRQVGPCCVALA